MTLEEKASNMLYNEFIPWTEHNPKYWFHFVVWMKEKVQSDPAFAMMAMKQKKRLSN